MNDNKEFKRAYWEYYLDLERQFIEKTICRVFSR